MTTETKLDVVDEVIVETVTHTPKNQKIVLTYQGQTRTLREWAQFVQKPYHTLYSRFKVNSDPNHVFKGITVNTDVA
jgi:hypothetical protein